MLQVRLVLEYCDKGCLRSALDEGVFFMGKQGGGAGVLASLGKTNTRLDFKITSCQERACGVAVHILQQCLVEVMKHF